MSSADGLNWKKPLLLAAVLGVAGGGLYWMETSYNPSKEKSEERSKKPFPLDETPVARITVQDGARATFTLRCLSLDQKLCKPADASKWELETPIKTGADENNANGLLSNLNNLLTSETVSLAEESPDKRAALLTDYGLSAAQRTAKTARSIEVSLASGETIRMTFGELHPLGDTHFALLGNDETKVLLVPSYFKTNFDSDLTYFRDKKLFAVTPGKIASFELFGPKGRVKGVREGAEWMLEFTEKGKLQRLAGDIESVDTFLSSGLFATAKTFSAENKNSPQAKRILAGAKPAVRLQFVEQGKEKEPSGTFELTVFRKSTGATSTIYATSSRLDPLFSMDPGMINRLDKSVKDLRLARLIASLDRYNSSKLQFEGTAFGPKPFALIQKSQKWVIEGDEGTPLAQDRIGAFLDQLSGKRIRDFLAAKDARKGEEAGVTVTLFDGERERRKVRLWKSGATVYAKDLLSPRDEVALIEPGVLDAMPADPKAFRQDFQPPASATPTAEPPAPEHGTGS